MLSIGSGPATAMDYSWRSYNDKIVIDAVGEIKVDEAKNFIAWVEHPAENGTDTEQPLLFSILVGGQSQVEENGDIDR